MLSIPQETREAFSFTHQKSTSSSTSNKNYTGSESSLKDNDSEEKKINRSLDQYDALLEKNGLYH